MTYKNKRPDSAVSKLFSILTKGFFIKGNNWMVIRWTWGVEQCACYAKWSFESAPEQTNQTTVAIKLFSRIKLFSKGHSHLVKTNICINRWLITTSRSEKKFYLLNICCKKYPSLICSTMNIKLMSWEIFVAVRAATIYLNKYF